MLGNPAVSAAAAAALPANGISAQPKTNGLGAKGNGLFDPLGPFDVDALNAAYIQKHQAALLGSHLRLQKLLLQELKRDSTA